MAFSTVHSFSLAGLDAPPVLVETHLSNGLPSFALVGLPDTEVREARDRVRAAIIQSGFEFPRVRLTVNLAPADLPKESGRFDLPIALGILAASRQIPAQSLASHVFAGELSLSGSLRPIRGALAMALAAAALENQTLILPVASAAEALLAGTRQPVLSADTLTAVCLHLRGETRLAAPDAPEMRTRTPWPDLADVKGQHRARRALEIAAAGEHSLLMAGPPGSGKSMLAHRLPGLLPDLSPEAARRSAALLSLGSTFDPAEFGARPYRSPHHSASAVALVGGGNPPAPGEISKATEGILFLDELPEFQRPVLEALREPLETGCIQIARAGRHATFPARFQLVAAMNPCPCGWLGHGNCTCTADQIRRYQSRLSGPLLDRIDLQIAVPPVDPEQLIRGGPGEDSASVRSRVIAARARQQTRQGKLNAALASGEIDMHCPLDEAGRTFLERLAHKQELSARSQHRLLRIARTIADLAAAPAIQASHLAEASQMRRNPASS